MTNGNEVRPSLRSESKTLRSEFESLRSELPPGLRTELEQIGKRVTPEEQNALARSCGNLGMVFPGYGTASAVERILNATGIGPGSFCRQRQLSGNS